MSNPYDGLAVQHARTGADGNLLEVHGKPGAQMCRVGFDDGVEEVPKALLRPRWNPFNLLADGVDEGVYPYDGWLRRERYRLLDAFRNDFALGLANSRVDPQLHQVSVALRALEKSQPRLILADEVGLGKTIEAGLILKEVRARMGVDLERVLLIVPASLVERHATAAPRKRGQAGRTGTSRRSRSCGRGRGKPHPYAEGDVRACGYEACSVSFQPLTAFRVSRHWSPKSKTYAN